MTRSARGDVCCVSESLPVSCVRWTAPDTDGQRGLNEKKGSIAATAQQGHHAQCSEQGRRRLGDGDDLCHIEESAEFRFGAIRGHKQRLARSD